MKKLLLILLLLSSSSTLSNDLDLRVFIGFNFDYNSPEEAVVTSITPIAPFFGTYAGELYYNFDNNLSVGIFIRRSRMDTRVVSIPKYEQFKRYFGSVEILAGPSVMYNLDQFFLSVSYALTNNQYEYIFQYINTPYKEYDLIISDEIFLLNLGGKIELGKDTDLLFRLEYTLRFLEQYKDINQTISEQLTIHRLMPYIGVSYKLF